MTQLNILFENLKLTVTQREPNTSKIFSRNKNVQRVFLFLICFFFADLLSEIMIRGVGNSVSCIKNSVEKFIKVHGNPLSYQ